MSNKSWKENNTLLKFKERFGDWERGEDERDNQAAMRDNPWNYDSYCVQNGIDNWDKYRAYIKKKQEDEMAKEEAERAEQEAEEKRQKTLTKYRRGGAPKGTPIKGLFKEDDGKWKLHVGTVEDYDYVDYTSGHGGYAKIFYIVNETHPDKGTYRWSVQNCFFPTLGETGPNWKKKEN